MSPLPPYLNDEILTRAITQWLSEDVGSGDATTLATISPTRRARGELRAKANGVLAGSYVVGKVFEIIDQGTEIQWRIDDGGKLNRDDLIGNVAGPAAAILVGERLALNLLQRMSGIATATAAMVSACAGTNAKILDTRKTAPGLRLLDKWAVLQGGGTNHRIGLYDMMMIKDNHIASAGGIEYAVRAADSYRTLSERTDLLIELETRTLDEVRVGAGLEEVDRLLLDNMVQISADGTIDISMLEQAIAIVGGRKETEASGNVTLSSVPQIAATGVDYISSGTLTHSVVATDISLVVVVE